MQVAVVVDIHYNKGRVICFPSTYVEALRFEP